MSTLLENRLVFERQLEKMLLGKPERYKAIIYDMLNRHIEYIQKVSNIFPDIQTIATYMVELDREYVSARDNNE